MSVLTAFPLGPFPPIPGDWAFAEDYEGNQIWSQDVPTSPEEAASEDDEQYAIEMALEAGVRERRQVCRRTHGALFSETLGFVALAMAARGQRGQGK